MKNVSSSRKSAHLDFNPNVERRLVYDQSSGEFSEALKKSKYFIKAIPLPWLEQSLRLPFSATRVGLACWFLDGCNYQRPFVLNRAVCNRFKISVSDRKRGLRQLEAAGLITIQRQPGHLSLIEMVRDIIA